jgi:hypothetical protein
MFLCFFIAHDVRFLSAIRQMQFLPTCALWRTLLLSIKKISSTFLLTAKMTSKALLRDPKPAPELISLFHFLPQLRASGKARMRRKRCPRQQDPRKIVFSPQQAALVIIHLPAFQSMHGYSGFLKFIHLNSLPNSFLFMLPVSFSSRIAGTCHP